MGCTKIRDGKISIGICRVQIRWLLERKLIWTYFQVLLRKKIQRVSVEERQLTLDDTQGMFLVLGAGTLIGFFALFMECCFHGITKRCFSREIEDDDDDLETLYERNLNFWINDNITRAVRRRYSASSI